MASPKKVASPPKIAQPPRMAVTEMSNNDSRYVPERVDKLRLQ